MRGSLSPCSARAHTLEKLKNSYRREADQLSKMLISILADVISDCSCHYPENIEVNSSESLHGSCHR